MPLGNGQIIITRWVGWLFYTPISLKSLAFTAARRSLLFVFLLGICLGSLVAQPLVDADQMPYFPGCDQYQNGSAEKRTCSNKSLVNFISNQLLYPESAQASQTEGTVYVSFVVGADGQIQTPTILRDIGDGCGEAALDVLRKMPLWEAGVHKEKKVAVKLNLPIQFSFSPGSEEEEEVPYKVHWGLLKNNQISETQLKDNLLTPIQVRDLFGNDLLINELLFIYEKKRTYLYAQSNGRLTPKMEKVIRRAKKGGIFSIVATVQKNGEFINVERQFEIMDK